MKDKKFIPINNLSYFPKGSFTGHCIVVHVKPFLSNGSDEPN